MENIKNKQDINDIITRFKKILEGCCTIVDAMYFRDIYSQKYPFLNIILRSLVSSKKYPENMDTKTKQTLLQDIHKSPDRLSSHQIYSKNLDGKNGDYCLRRAIERMINSKKYEYHITTRKKMLSMDPSLLSTKIFKSCPHCGHNMCMNPDTDYVICGYGNSKQGFDWTGCSKDWCFKCGKMLCKHWDNHHLYLHMNRIHDHECCKKYTIMNNKNLSKDSPNYLNYPEDFCQCDNNYVNRIQKNDAIQYLNSYSLKN